MNKKLITLSIISSLGLMACSSENEKTVNDTLQMQIDNAASVNINYKPAESIIPLPNDFLLLTTADGTIEIPDETAARVAKVQDGGDDIDYGNPQNALGQLDGWSLQMPWSLGLERDNNLDLDPASYGGNIRIFELTGVAQPGVCVPTLAGGTCAVSSELTYGADFVASQSGDSLSIVPTHPLSAGTTHLLVVTNGVLDSAGNPMTASDSYQVLSGADLDDSRGGGHCELCCIARWCECKSCCCCDASY